MHILSPSPSIWHAGDAHVNFHLIAQGSELTRVDAGLLAHWRDLAASVNTLGRSLQEIRGPGHSRAP